MNMKCNQKYNLCDENPTDCHFELKTFVQRTKHSTFYLHNKFESSLWAVVPCTKVFSSKWQSVGFSSHKLYFWLHFIFIYEFIHCQYLILIEYNIIAFPGKMRPTEK